MKTRAKERLINLCAFFFVIALVVAVVIFVVLKLNYNVFYALLFTAVGLVAHYTLGLFFHELGHLVIAKAKKMRVGYINFGLFSIDYSDGVKVYPFTMFGENAGESAFLPTKDLTVKDFAVLASGGLVASLLYFIVCVIIAILVDTPLCYCLFLAGGLSSLYIFIVNVLPFDKTSDGSILFTRGYIKSIALGYEILKEINQNKIPYMPATLENCHQPLCKYFTYLFSAYENKEERCNEIISDLTDNIDKLNGEEYEFIFPEIVFNCCLNNSFTPEIRKDADNYFCGCNNSLPIIRAHYLYRIFLNEKEWAETIKNSYYKKLEDAPLFVKEVEKVLGKKAGL